MDLQTRKLNLITYLAQVKDELFIDKLENFILKKENNSELKPFTIEELMNRINQSETDYKNGQIVSQESLEKISANW